MRPLLLGLAAAVAATTIAATPAAALDPPSARFTAGSTHGVTIHHGLPPGFNNGFRRDRSHHDGGRDWRRHDRDGDSVYFGYRDYQGDTVWQANSYNDWWHERSDRAFPRWMQNNQDCDRLWWSGGGWRC